MPGGTADSISDRVRAWRELSHQEHVAAAALADENEKWVDAWVPEGWQRYRRRWNRWHGHVAVTLAVTDPDAVQLALDTECGTIPGSGGDVPGIPDAVCLGSTNGINGRKRRPKRHMTQPLRNSRNPCVSRTLSQN